MLQKATGGGVALCLVLSGALRRAVLHLSAATTGPEGALAGEPAVAAELLPTVVLESEERRSFGDHRSASGNVLHGEEAVSLMAAILHHLQALVDAHNSGDAAKSALCFTFSSRLVLWLILTQISVQLVQAIHLLGGYLRSVSFVEELIEKTEGLHISLSFTENVHLSANAGVGVGTTEERLLQIGQS